MALLAQQVVTRAAEILGTDIPAAVTPLGLLNEVGHVLYSHVEWAFLLRAPVTADLVATQNYVTLPPDFGEFRGRGAIATNGLTNFVKITTPDEYDDAVSYGIAPVGFTYIGAVFTPESPSTGPDPVPRLYVYPVPTTNQPGAVTILYRATWRQLTSAEDHINLPTWMEPLFFDCVLAYLKGLTEHDNATVAERLAKVLTMDNPLYRGARRRDGFQQSVPGPMEGGHVQDRRRGNYGGWVGSTLANPS